ncbi:MAG: 30S ribosomal protein S20, partial [Lachnospiraceae bacterium]|nr:30S ribosomal protein S20 [Lachnospiraceae bacterium]
KTAVKKVDVAVAEGNKEAAVAALQNAISTIDRAATKGVYHKNTASRKISRLTKAVNNVQ